MNVEFYLTGSASNEIQWDSLGGLRSSVKFITDSQDNLFEPVDYASSLAGDYRYECLCARNEGTNEIVDFRVYTYNEDSTTVTSDYSASGDITVGVTSDDIFDDLGGYVSNEMTSEVMYYSSASNDMLTVHSIHRGLRGTSASAGSIDDTLVPFPWIDLGLETDVSNEIQLTASCSNEPSGITWTTSFGTSDADGYANGAKVGGLTDDDIDVSGEAFVWCRLAIPVSGEYNPTYELGNVRYGGYI